MCMHDISTELKLKLTLKTGLVNGFDTSGLFTSVELIGAGFICIEFFNNILIAG